MPLRCWFSKLVTRTMISHYYAGYTGFEYQKVFCSGLQCWCIAAYTALHPATWPQIYSAWHISTHVGDCALPLRQAHRWLLHALCVLPLATPPSWRLLHLYGTVSQSQSGHHRHCKFSAADRRPHCLPDLTAVLSLTKNVSLHWLLHDFTVIVNLLRVLAVLGLNTALNETHSSSLSSTTKKAASGTMPMSS